VLLDKMLFMKISFNFSKHEGHTNSIKNFSSYLTENIAFPLQRSVG